MKNTRLLHPILFILSLLSLPFLLSCSKKEPSLFVAVNKEERLHYVDKNGVKLSSKREWYFESEDKNINKKKYQRFRTLETVRGYYRLENNKLFIIPEAIDTSLEQYRNLDMEYLYFDFNSAVGDTFVVGLNANNKPYENLVFKNKWYSELYSDTIFLLKRKIHNLPIPLFNHLCFIGLSKKYRIVYLIYHDRHSRSPYRCFSLRNKWEKS